MAEETAVAEPEPETPEAAAPSEDLDAKFQAYLDARDGEEAPAATEDDPTAQVSDALPADDSVAAPIAESDEGPSFLMKQAAVQAGVNEDYIEAAVNDKQLEKFIELAQAARQRQEQAEAAPAQDFDLPLELPDDEFGADDPIRKNLAAWREALKSELADLRKAQGMFAHFANQQLKAADEAKAREQHEIYHKLYGPFDKFLDSFGSSVLGDSSKKFTPDQEKVRRAIADKYYGLGATAEMSDEDKAYYAELAVQAYDKRLAEQRTQKLKAARQQPGKVIGGAGTVRNVERAMTIDDKLAWWDRVRAGQESLPEDYRK